MKMEQPSVIQKQPGLHHLFMIIYLKMFRLI